MTVLIPMYSTLYTCVLIIHHKSVTLIIKVLYCEMYINTVFFLCFQDHVCELLNTIDACQVFFDIVRHMYCINTCNYRMLLVIPPRLYLKDVMFLLGLDKYADS